MLAYHGSHELKAQKLAQVRAHRAADELVKGKYWQDGKGCAVGCTIHGDSHAAYETALGIPAVLAHLEDKFFEGMENSKAMEWPERFLDAIEPGSDLSLVWPRFAKWLLTDFLDGIEGAITDGNRAAIGGVVALFDRQIAGDTPSLEEWAWAVGAAGAARAAAGAAWAARAAGAAWAAAEAAAWAAAEEAGEAWAAAGADAYSTMADKLIELMGECKTEAASC